MHPAATAPQGSSSIDMQVDVVEHMGDHQYVYLRAPGLPDNIIMKAPAKERFATGANVPVFFDSAHAHIFADTSEHALNLTLPVGFQRQQ
jgi:ABC-type sugar transport system ATPase subunit